MVCQVIGLSIRSQMCGGTNKTTSLLVISLANFITLSAFVGQHLPQQTPWTQARSEETNRE